MPSVDLDGLEGFLAGVAGIEGYVIPRMPVLDAEDRQSLSVQYGGYLSHFFDKITTRCGNGKRARSPLSKITLDVSHYDPCFFSHGDPS
jgi:hypothetical protein